MLFHIHDTIVAGLLLLKLATAGPLLDVETHSSYAVRPFKVDLAKEVPRMKRLIQTNHLPDNSEYPHLGSTAGIDLNILRTLKEEWTTDFNWEKEEDSINQYDLYIYSTMLVE
jgi:hypothetical protein